MDERLPAQRKLNLVMRARSAASLLVPLAATLFACADVGSDSTVGGAANDGGAPGAPPHDPRDDSSRADSGTSGAVAQAGPIGMNDASILFPLENGDTELLTATSTGAKGAILPREIFDAVCAPTTCADIPRLRYASLRVVSVRLDPCAPSMANVTSAPEKCEPQIRLVLQPIANGSAADASIHAIYRVSAEDVSSLLSEVLTLRGSAPVGWENAPLNVHPIMKKEGLSGAFAKGVMAAVLARVGQTALSRVARMDVTQGTASSWTFTAVDVGAAALLTPVPIPVTPAVTFEQLANDAPGQIAAKNARILGLAGNAFSTVTPPEVIQPLLDQSDVTAPTHSEAERWAAYEAALRIENPRIHTNATVDCVSCHLASPLRMNVPPASGFGARPSSARYVPSSTEMTTLMNRNPTAFSFINFGYLINESISQRTVNETAEVVDYFRRKR